MAAADTQPTGHRRLEPPGLSGARGSAAHGTARTCPPPRALHPLGSGAHCRARVVCTPDVPTPGRGLAGLPCRPHICPWAGETQEAPLVPAPQPAGRPCSLAPALRPRRPRHAPAPQDPLLPQVGAHLLPRGSWRLVPFRPRGAHVTEGAGFPWAGESCVKLRGAGGDTLPSGGPCPDRREVGCLSPRQTPALGSARSVVWWGPTGEARGDPHDGLGQPCRRGGAHAAGRVWRTVMGCGGKGLPTSETLAPRPYPMCSRRWDAGPLPAAPSSLSRPTGSVCPVRPSA